MKLLITGAKGFLGSRLVEAYKREYEIYEATHQNMDITNIDQVKRIFELFQPDVVIHCGAIADISECNFEPELSRKINVYGTQNIAIACREFNARMIFCSSDQVYINEWRQEFEPDYWLPHKEDEQLQPLPLYGQQKLEAEQLCLQEQPDSVILRLAMLYDTPDEKAKASNKGTFVENLMDLLTTSTVKSFYITNRRGITNCQEVVKNMEKAMKLPSGIYNFGSSNDKNLYETIYSVFEYFGKAELCQPNQNGDRRNLTMNLDKINSYGIQFETTKQGMIHYLTREGSAFNEPK